MIVAGLHAVRDGLAVLARLFQKLRWIQLFREKLISISLVNQNIRIRLMRLDEFS